jgi:hypothetical protein
MWVAFAPIGTKAESEQILGVWNIMREKLLQGDSLGGAQAADSYVLLGLAANQQPPNKTTDAMVHYLIGRQGVDIVFPHFVNDRMFGFVRVLP